MFFGEGQASLSFSHLNKDDEGLYTLRIVSRGGVSDHSAFMFVRGASDGVGVGSKEKVGRSYIAGGDREETQESGWRALGIAHSPDKKHPKRKACQSS